MLYVSFIPTVIKVPDTPVIPYPRERPELSGAPYRPSCCEGWSELDVMRFFPEDTIILAKTGK